MGLFGFFKKLFGGGDDYGRKRQGAEYGGHGAQFKPDPAAGAPRGGPVPPPPPGSPEWSRVVAASNVRQVAPLHQHREASRVPRGVGHWRKTRSKTPPQLPARTMGEFDWKQEDKSVDAAKLESLYLPVLRAPVEIAKLLGCDLKTLIDFGIRASPPARAGHYATRLVPKKRGGWRVIEAPKPKLKAMQRRLKELIVDVLPASEFAHGFRLRRNPKSNASAHVGDSVVVCLDLADFFPTITFNRVAGLLRSVGYGRMVASVLAALMTHKTRANSIHIGKETVTFAQAKQRLKDVDLQKLLGSRGRKLPQGAPTSPNLANAICWRMDKRLGALAKKYGITYTRYADDICFSGEFEHDVPSLLALVYRIIKTEGFAINEAKTRVMRAPGQQRVTGIVVNEKVNIARADYDKLKAILHNCVKHGPAGQNRDKVANFRAHLEGRVAHAAHINPLRGAKLENLLAKIAW